MTANLHIVGVQFSVCVRAVQLVCEEIGIGYTLGSEVNGQHYALRSDALKSIHPFSKVPVLLVDGQILYETQAICRYLDNNFNQSRLQPNDPWLRAQVDQWCGVINLYVDKVVVRNYLLEFLFPKGENGSVRQEAVEAAMPEILSTVAILENQLGDNNFLVANQYTLADIILAPIIDKLCLAPNNDYLINKGSPLRGYIERIRARSSAKNVFV